MDQLDIVQLKNANRVKFLSGPKNYTTSPHGNWTVVGFIADDAILAKDQTIIKVPMSDLRIVGIYSIDDTLNKISKIGVSQQINMTEYLNDLMGWPLVTIPKLLSKYGFPRYADNTQHRDKIAEQLSKVVEENGENPWV